MTDIAFRALAVEDMQQMYFWLARPHVAKWYAPTPSSFAEMVAKYAPRTEPGNVVQAFVVRADGADCGYIQTYPIREFPDYARKLGCSESAAGVDLGRGLGSQVVRRFVDEVMFGANGAGECIAGPSEGNLASIRAFEKAGFSRWKVIQMEGAEPECVMRLGRTV
jgi:aminoglycoside 6'-N-acetyltransferase